jgi:cardiolipin synthase
MFNVPNLLTLGRLLLVPCFLYASMRGMYATAFVIFVSAAVTDILDGMIARRWNLRSRFGALFDPAADKLLMVSGFVFYTFADGLPVTRIPGWLTFAVFARDFLITCFAYLMYTRIQIKRFPPSWLGKLSTVFQAVTLAMVIGVNAFMPRSEMLTEVLFRVSLVLTLSSGWGYLYRANQIVLDTAAEAK